ncbi:MAG: twin-arginine translocation signal domain-containing protein, partial [Campylobacterales bacterium]|nr:twin-arginine translocation signal domain-containing protein [Campylobacterales bacterium]
MKRRDFLAASALVMGAVGMSGCYRSENQTDNKNVHINRGKTVKLKL